jgi:hypothetical protein
MPENSKCLNCEITEKRLKGFEGITQTLSEEVDSNWKLIKELKAKLYSKRESEGLRNHGETNVKS